MISAGSRQGALTFCSDLDNTMIYSYRHEIGEKKRCVEIYQGREISFMTERSYEILADLQKKVLFVPVTTRTVEQYERIDLGFLPEYALTCNGGVLLVRGREEESWYQKSLDLVSNAGAELERAYRYLGEDEDRSFEVRNIRNLFLFTKSERPERTIEKMRAVLNPALVTVFGNGTKVYVLPKNLNKGTAVRRFRERMGAERIIAAGDSSFDLPMLEEAETALAPGELLAEHPVKKDVLSVGGGQLFSDFVLEYIMTELIGFQN